MTFGPDIIRQCAECAKRFTEPTITSGNSFGERLWTDAKRYYPSYPGKQQLVKCPHCHGLLWLDDQKQLGELPTWATPGMKAACADAKHFGKVAAEDYLAALEKFACDHHRERYLRIQAWWAGNDARRDGDTTRELSASEAANLCALAELLDETRDDERLLKAEIFRELGRYDAALGLLSHQFCDELHGHAVVITSLAQQRVPWVKELNIGRGMPGGTIFITSRAGTPR